MKKVTLIRHAKSSWENPQLRDIDRPLNNKGVSDANLMANVLIQKNIIPDRIVCSPARRTQETCGIIMANLELSPHIKSIEENIYFKSNEAIIETLQQINNKFEHTFLFGHQPFIASLYAQFCIEDLDHIPTCGICHIHFEIDDWKDLNKGLGTSIFVIFPKMFK